MKWLRFVPKNYLSWFVGAAANIPLPAPLNTFSIGIFARVYGIDTTAATRSVNEFRSIGEFFTRDIKPELRPIADGLVCPVDGKLRSVESPAHEGSLTQVKGIHYSIPELLGNAAESTRFFGGSAFSFYLSPTDAHHIHAPCDGEIVKTVHIPGKLWPVNDWAINNVPALFAVNERVVTIINSTHGLFAVVMVGATNVGKIEATYTSLVTNTRPWAHQTQRTFVHEPGIPVVRGAKIGTFHMGSSVVLLSERRVHGEDCLLEQSGERAVRYGGSLLEVSCRAEKII
jgi:phosphatidylserine decarboxylase